MMQSKQRGYGLIEVLVSVLILAIGLLGLAGLQTQSLRFNNEAYFRTQATLLAMDMADRLRSNFETARTSPGSYTFALTENAPSSVTDCTTSACSPSELAQYDFKSWKTRALELLPGAQVALTPDVVGTATPWQSYTIEIQYKSTDKNPADSDGANSGLMQDFKYRVKI